MRVDEAGVVVAVVNALNAVNIPHMLVGSLSSNAYGIPRSTKDADLVIQLGSNSLSKLLQHLPPGFRLESQIGFETITATTRFRMHYDNLSTPFMIEFFELSDDAHDQLRFSKRAPLNFGGSKSFVPKAEDVVIMKLRWAIAGKSREKDTDDARNVLSVQKGKLDLSYIRHWTDKHGSRELLEKLLASISGVPNTQ
jgi:hypothetical protein